jgi:hypothetical protein
MNAREARVEAVVPGRVSDPAEGAVGWSRFFLRRSALFLVPKLEVK